MLSKEARIPTKLKVYPVSSISWRGFIVRYI